MWEGGEEGGGGGGRGGGVVRREGGEMSVWGGGGEKGGGGGGGGERKWEGMRVRGGEISGKEWVRKENGGRRGCGVGKIEKDMWCM